MPELTDIVAGWTAPIGPFTLRLDGAPFPLTSMVVEPVITTSLGNPVTPGGTVTLLNQITYPGQVMYTPAATDFLFEADGSSFRQAYKLHWKVTDGLGHIAFFPDGEPDIISVYKP